MRSIYEIREQSSRMYAWSALVTSQLMVEIPLNIIGSSVFFLCWYWTVGFDSDRGAYTYLFLCVLMPLYCTSL
jgi:ATP-binding cassette subfamily G (WHITE) protein 2 (SNQ2)